MRTQEAIDAFLLDRRASNLSPATIYWYRKRLRPFERRYPELPETPGPIREFQASLTCGDETQHGYFRALHALYNFIHMEYGFPLSAKRKRDEANPITKIKPPKVRQKVMRSLSLEQLHQLLNAGNGARESKWHFRDQTMVQLIADTGMRLGEAILRWDNINQDTVYVNGKTGEREVPILPETRRLLERLRQWNEANFGESPFVFLGKKGPLTSQGIQEAVERAFKRAGLSGPRSTPHTLRHTFGCNWNAEGGDPYTLQQIFGHTTMTMVKKYVRVNVREMVRQHQRFSPVRAQVRLAQGSLWEDRPA